MEFAWIFFEVTVVNLTSSYFLPFTTWELVIVARVKCVTLK